MPLSHMLNLLGDNFPLFIPLILAGAVFDVHPGNQNVRKYPKNSTEVDLHIIIEQVPLTSFRKASRVCLF